MTRARLTAALSALLICAGAVGGYAVGKHSAEEDATTQTELDALARTLGAAVGSARGLPAGFVQGLEEAFSAAYLEAYRSGYRRAWVEDGLDPPGADDPRLTEIVVPGGP